MGAACSACNGMGTVEGGPCPKCCAPVPVAPVAAPVVAPAVDRMAHAREVKAEKAAKAAAE
jgi:hypothetical protein